MSRSSRAPRQPWSCLLGLLAVITLLGLASTANAQELKALRHLDSNHAKVTALVVNLENMQTIAALNPDLRLTPASVSKLFATAGALEQFGPDHRFTTRFASNGNVTGGVLHGNLVFVGGGDPMLDTRDLRALIQKLKAAGVREITGDLIVDNSLFGPFHCFIEDRCDARTRASEAYSAPLSSVGVNFGTVKVTVYPGDQPGDNTRVVFTPLDLPGYIIDNQVTTGSPDARPLLAVWREYEEGHNIIHLRGELPAGGRHYSTYRAVANAAVQTQRVLSSLLADAGIVVEGHADIRPVATSGMHTLATINSENLSQMLIPMLAYSNNYMADMLTLDIATARGYGAPLTLSRAAQELEQLAQRAMQEVYPKHVDKPGQPIFTSGSGLSVSNKISARHLIALLSHMYRQPALFPAFYGAIPVPVSSASNTLKHGNQAWLTRLVAKTGTLSEPVTVRALAGYFRLQNGDFGAFAVIINGTQQRPGINFYDTVLAYQEDIEAILAEY